MSVVALANVVWVQSSQSQTTYTLKATPKTVAWGYYDAKATPVLRVKFFEIVEVKAI